MKSRFSSKVETKLLLEMIKTTTHSDDIMMNNLKKIVSDTLWKSFSDYKFKHLQTVATKNVGSALGYGLKIVFGSYTKGEFSNNISKISQLQYDIDAIERQLNFISKIIPKMKSEKLFVILKINKKQGLQYAINYSRVVEIEISKRV